MSSPVIIQDTRNEVHLHKTSLSFYRALNGVVCKQRFGFEAQGWGLRPTDLLAVLLTAVIDTQRSWLWPRPR